MLLCTLTVLPWTQDTGEWQTDTQGVKLGHLGHRGEKLGFMDTVSNVQIYLFLNGILK